MGDPTVHFPSVSISIVIFPMDRIIREASHHKNTCEHFHLFSSLFGFCSPRISVQGKRRKRPWSDSDPWRCCRLGQSLSSSPADRIPSPRPLVSELPPTFPFPIFSHRIGITPTSPFLSSTLIPSGSFLWFHPFLPSFFNIYQKPGSLALVDRFLFRRSISGHRFLAVYLCNN